MNEKMLIKNLYDLDKTIAKPLLEKLDYPWEALPKIKDFIIALGKLLTPKSTNSVAKIYGLQKVQLFIRPLTSAALSSSVRMQR